MVFFLPTILWKKNSVSLCWQNDLKVAAWVPFEKAIILIWRVAPDPVPYVSHVVRHASNKTCHWTRCSPESLTSDWQSAQILRTWKELPRSLFSSEPPSKSRFILLSSEPPIKVMLHSSQLYDNSSCFLQCWLLGKPSHSQLPVELYNEGLSVFKLPPPPCKSLTNNTCLSWHRLLSDQTWFCDTDSNNIRC